MGQAFDPPERRFDGADIVDGSVKAADLATGVAFPGFGTDGATACVGNDSRLSDQRVPTDGSVVEAKLGAGAFGATATTACAGNDSRLSNTRAPTAGSVTSLSPAVAVEALASPVVTAGAIEVVIPFATLATTSTVGFVTDRKYEVIEVVCHKVGTTGGAADTLDVQVAAASILTGGTPSALNAKAGDAAVFVTVAQGSVVIPSGSTVTFVATAGTTDCQTRGWIRLAPVA